MREILSRRFKVLGVGSDVALAIAMQGLGVLVSFVYQLVLIRSLDKVEAGNYFLILAYIMLAAGLADFGMASTITPRLAVSGGKATPSFRAALHLRGLALGAAILILFLYLIVSAEWNMMLYVGIAYIAVVISHRSTGLRQLYELFWRLRGRTYLISILGTVDMLLGLVILAILASIGELTLLAATLVFALCSLPGCIAIIAPLWKSIRSTEAFHRLMPRRLYRVLLGTSLPIALMAFIGQASGQIETFIIDSTQLGRDQIAAYNVAVRPLVALMFMATTFAFGMSPIVAQLYKGVRSDSTFEYIMSISVRLLGTIGLLICAGCWLYSEQIMHIFGGEYIAEAYILRIYSTVNLLIFLVVLFDQFLLAIGKRQQAFYGAMIQIGIALAIEPIAISIWGIRGLVVAKAVSVICLIGFQVSRFSPRIRLSVLQAFLRLLPSVLVLVLALLVSGSMVSIYRTALVVPLLVASLLLTRVVTLPDLKVLKGLRVS